MRLLAALALFALASAKVYERCELARELLHKHRVPKDQLPTWLCIADRESNMNTSAVGTMNGDGSADHGIFQISDKYWCSPGWACGLDCDRLRDDDLSDDWKCARRIYKEHRHLSGDGFNAWAVYNTHCKSSTVSDYLKGCFNQPSSQQLTPALPWLSYNSLSGFTPSYQGSHGFHGYYHRPQPQPLFYIFRYH